MSEVSVKVLRNALRKLGRNVVSITKSDPEVSPVPWFYIAVERYVEGEYSTPLNPVLKAKDVMDLLLQEFKVTMADSSDRTSVLIIAGGGSYERMNAFIKLLNFGGKWPIVIAQDVVELDVDSLVDNRSDFKDDIEYDEEAIAEKYRVEQERERNKIEKAIKRPLNEREKYDIDVWLNPVIDFFNQHHMNRPIRIEGHLDPYISMKKPSSRGCSLTFEFKQVGYITKSLWVDRAHLDDYAIKHARAMKLGEILAEYGKETLFADEYINTHLVQRTIYQLNLRELQYISKRLKEDCPKLPIFDIESRRISELLYP